MQSNYVSYSEPRKSSFASVPSDGKMVLLSKLHSDFYVLYVWLYNTRVGGGQILQMIYVSKMPPDKINMTIICI